MHRVLLFVQTLILQELYGKIAQSYLHSQYGLLPVEYAGESSESKIKRVREFLVEKKADYFLLTSLEDIAWLLNMRGNDVESTPVILSYLLLGEKKLTWYVQENAF